MLIANFPVTEARDRAHKQSQNYIVEMSIAIAKIAILVRSNSVQHRGCSNANCDSSNTIASLINESTKVTESKSETDFLKTGFEISAFNLS